MRTIVLAACIVLAVSGCQAAGNAYRVNHVSDAGIRIDGELAEPVWQRAEPLTAFRNPWRGGGLPTEFRALCDSRNLYFAFTVGDDSLRLEKGWQGEKTLDREDRVEIYFAAYGRLERYYCVEIDPQGRVHDFTGSFPRKGDNTWNLPGLRTAGKVSAKGYVVEGSSPAGPEWPPETAGRGEIGSVHTEADLNPGPRVLLPGVETTPCNRLGPGRTLLSGASDATTPNRRLVKKSASKSASGLTETCS